MKVLFANAKQENLLCDYCIKNIYSEKLTLIEEHLSKYTFNKFISTAVFI